MTKTRMEAFSDGVFAIVITLLILEVHVPEGIDPEHLGEELFRLFPTFGAYILSFFVVGLYWMVHHRTMHVLKEVNQAVLWINVIWLMFVGIMPFTTSLLGSYPLQVIPIVVYGLNLILTNVTGWLSVLYVQRHPELSHTPISAESIRKVTPRYAVINGLYALGIALAWFWPMASYAIYVGVLLWLIFMYWSERQVRKTIGYH